MSRPQWLTYLYRQLGDPSDVRRKPFLHSWWWKSQCLTFVSVEQSYGLHEVTVHHQGRSVTARMDEGLTDAEMMSLMRLVGIA